MTTTTYTVTGMTCDHCANAVRTEVGRIPGVTNVAVDLPASTVTITSETPVAATDIRSTLNEAGYQLAG
jgi:copper chaperone